MTICLGFDRSAVEELRVRPHRGHGRHLAHRDLGRGLPMPTAVISAMASLGPLPGGALGVPWANGVGAPLPRRVKDHCRSGNGNAGTLDVARDFSGHRPQARKRERKQEH